MSGNTERTRNEAATGTEVHWPAPADEHSDAPLSKTPRLRALQKETLQATAVEKLAKNNMPRIDDKELAST